MIYRNGDKYEGEWLAGSRHGTGNLTFAENDEFDRKFYSGNWENDQFSGMGLLIRKNGEKHEGQFENGIVNGFGKRFYANGDIYEGKFRNGKHSGHGIFTWKNGNKYVGEWKNNFKNGYGTLYSSSGEILQQGQWIDDEFTDE